MARANYDQNTESGKVSVLLPAYNEEDKIINTVLRLLKELQKQGRIYEIIVVDDGSTDRTRKTASLLQENPLIRVVGYGRNRGKGYALKYGLNYATGDYVAFMDSDADIQFSTKLIDALQRSDVAIGSKRHPLSRVKQPRVRILLSAIFNLLTRALTELEITDTQTGLKAFRRRQLVDIIDLVSVERYAFDVELLLLAKLAGLRMCVLPVDIESNSLLGSESMLGMLLDLIVVAVKLRTKWYQRRLKPSANRC